MAKLVRGSHLAKQPAFVGVIEEPDEAPGDPALDGEPQVGDPVADPGVGRRHSDREPT